MWKISDYPADIQLQHLGSSFSSAPGVSRVAAWGAGFARWETNDRMTAALGDSNLPEEWSESITGGAHLEAQTSACTVLVTGTANLADMVRRVQSLGWRTRSATAEVPDLATFDGPYFLVLAEADETRALERIRAYRAEDMNSTIVWIADNTSVRSAVEAMRLGVLDVINGDPADEELRHALRRAADVAMLRFQRLGERRAALVKTKSLTNLELEVYRRLLAGDTNKQIAARLDKAVRTVELYRHELMRKMDAHSPAELVKLGVLAGLIEPWSDSPSR